MKKLTLTKILLISPLVLGLLGCKKDKPRDPLDRPEPFTIKRELTERERYEVLNKTLENRTRVTSIEAYASIRQVDHASKNEFIISGTSTSNFYLNYGVKNELKFEINEKSGNGIEYPTQEIALNGTQVWKDGLLYMIQMMKFEKENYDYEIMVLDEEEIPDHRPEIDNYYDLDILLNNPIFLDTEGNYHIIEEEFDYVVGSTGSQYTHQMIEMFSDLLINKKFEIERQYLEQKTMIGTFDDSNIRDEKDLNLVTLQKEATSIRHGTLKEIPKLDEFVAGFPEVYVRNDVSVYRVCSPASYDPNHHLVVDNNTTLWTDTLFTSSSKTKSAGVKGEFLVTDFTLNKYEGVAFNLKYTTSKFKYDGFLQHAFHTDSVDLEPGIPKSLKDILKVVRQGDMIYLVYVPLELDAPNTIDLSVAFDFTISCNLTDIGDQIGISTFTNIEVLERIF
jgi:hypothetical protein